MPDEKPEGKPGEKHYAVPELWPQVPGGFTIYGAVEADVFQQVNGKPAIRLTFPDRTYPDKKLVIWVTANIMEMLSGLSRGARLRYEDHGGRPGGLG